jgi:hypothetical protein
MDSLPSRVVSPVRIAALLKDDLERALDRALWAGLLAEAPAIAALVWTIVPQGTMLSAMKDRTLVRHFDGAARAGFNTLAATSAEL